MTKSKTIIATLGIVAGLGAAALPLASYATQTAQSVTGNVQLAVEVQPAIAMTIVGNNDNHAGYNDGTTSYAPVDNFNPASIASTAETTEGAGDGVTRTLDGHDIPVTAVAGTSSSYASLFPNSMVDGSDTTNGQGFKSTIKIYTNSMSGYTLSVKDADSTLALTRDNTDGKGTATIAAGTTIEAGTSNWAYKVSPSDGTIDNSANSWKAIAATDLQIAHEDVKTSNGSEHVVAYGVSTSVDQQTGVYTDTIVYTATTK